MCIVVFDATEAAPTTSISKLDLAPNSRPRSSWVSVSLSSDESDNLDQDSTQLDRLRDSVIAEGAKDC